MMSHLHATPGAPCGGSQCACAAGLRSASQCAAALPRPRAPLAARALAPEAPGSSQHPGGAPRPAGGSSSGTTSTSGNAAAAAAAAAAAEAQSAVEARLAQLRDLQAASTQALAQRPPAASSAGGAYYRAMPQTVDARMYEQLVKVHNKLTKQMTSQESYVLSLQEEIDHCNDNLEAASELLKQISMEFGTTKRIAESASAAVQFGVDPKEAAEKVEKLTRRLETMEKAVQEKRAGLSSRVARRVPVEWVGCANEVVLMGDFDGWTRGRELSAEDVTSDSVYARFECELRLRPGRYRVKLLVDGEWRLANGWPMELDDSGNEVNVLTVE